MSLPNAQGTQPIGTANNATQPFGDLNTSGISKAVQSYMPTPPPSMQSQGQIAGPMGTPVDPNTQMFPAFNTYDLYNQSAFGGA